MQKMKITDINLKIYRWERSVPITNGLYTYTHNVLNIIEIENLRGTLSDRINK